MTIKDWYKVTTVRRASPQCDWGEPEKVARELVFLLDKFCATEKLKPVVTCGTQGKHLPDSQHYYRSEDEPGHACDVMFPQVRMQELPDVYLEALKYDFGGLGIYNQWRLSPQSAPIGGLHFDMRNLVDDKFFRKATWIWTEKGMIAMTMENLKENFK